MKKVILLISGLFLFTAITIAQTFDNKKLKLFVEGSTFDFNYMRNNTPFVDFVNDPKVCDVHAIITKQSTGGGGNHFSIEFYGIEFSNISKFQLSCNTYSFDTDEIIRKKLTKTLHSGLLLFINQKTGLADININISSSQDTNTTKIQRSEINDPWRQWIFRLGADAGFSGEEQKKNVEYELSARAVKVTDKWKVSNEYDYERREGTIKKDDGSTVNALKIEQDADIKLVLSLNPHWSYGVFLQGKQSTYKNTKMALGAMPALQYNAYNWNESDRRQFTFSYYVGPSYNEYYETTILNTTSEWLWKESMEINLKRVETWGEIDVSLEGGHYFPDFTNYYYETGVDLSVRISKGFSVNFRIQAESIHNQMYLPAGDLTDEELYLNIRKLPTTFEYSGRIGLRFQFGSIYNNIVNERL